MYRDDKGGWISSTLIQNCKVVGKDFRDLPIVHIGKGRPNIKMIRLLEKNPDYSKPADDEQLLASKDYIDCNQPGC